MQRASVHRRSIAERDRGVYGRAWVVLVVASMMLLLLLMSASCQERNGYHCDRSIGDQPARRLLLRVFRHLHVNRQRAPVLRGLPRAAGVRIDQPSERRAATTNGI